MRNRSLSASFPPPTACITIVKLLVMAARVGSVLTAVQSCLSGTAYCAFKPASSVANRECSYYRPYIWSTKTRAGTTTCILLYLLSSTGFSCVSNISRCGKGTRSDVATTGVLNPPGVETMHLSGNFTLANTPPVPARSRPSLCRQTSGPCGAPLTEDPAYWETFYDFETDGIRRGK